MTMQITVRLADENVEFLDQLVADGKVKSRAEAVDRALRRERRHAAALRDAEIYARTAPDPELEAWAAHVSAHPPRLDD
jgi:Arc/MetJ-type ribon-helix-helix transcriptional regulator